jgi:short subunit dehydrogenase-like uncharacterized protein
LIYGAAGYMGRLVSRAAVDLGLRPLLAGRDESSLAPLASELSLDYRVVALNDETALDQMLSGVTALLNAAGPFIHTWKPLVNACIRCGVHYLDFAGEVSVFEGIRTRGHDARRSGVMLLPGVGFDVVPSDCLAVDTAARLPGAQTLRLAVSGLTLISRGSARTVIEPLGWPAYVRRNGDLRTIPHGSIERRFDFGAGAVPAIAVSWADLASAFNSTGIRNIETYVEATPLVRAIGASVPEPVAAPRRDVAFRSDRRRAENAARGHRRGSDRRRGAHRVGTSTNA